MKWMPLLMLLVGCTSGCTSFRVSQKDESTGDRIITTEIRGTAWFSSAQAIAQIKALQTDKTQSFGAGSIGQHGATNTVEALQALARMLEALRP